MKKINLISILLAIFIMACSSVDKLPEEVLNEEQMVNVIVAVEVTQALYKLKYANKDSVNFNQLVEVTLKELNTNQNQFNTSLEYYASYPKKLESFYDKAMVIITQKQAEIQAVKNVKEED